MRKNGHHDTEPGTNSQPRILLSTSDHARLIGLASAALERFPDAATRLLDEADRAEVVEDRALPEDAVAMYAHVEFHDAAHGTTHRVQLVYPGEADIAAGRISVLTLIGAALIGLSAGQSIAWPTRNGRERRLTVLRVGGEPFEDRGASSVPGGANPARGRRPG